MAYLRNVLENTLLTQNSSGVELIFSSIVDASKPSSLTWNSMLALVTTILKERHDAIKFIVFKKEGQSIFSAFIILHTDSCIIFDFYRPLASLIRDHDTVGGIATELINFLYRHSGGIHDLNLPVIIH